MSFQDLIANYGGEEHFGGGDASVIVEKKSEEEGLGLVNYDYHEEEAQNSDLLGVYSDRRDRYSEERDYYSDESVGMGLETALSPSNHSPSNLVCNLNDSNALLSITDTSSNIMIMNNSSSLTPSTNYSSWKDEYPIDGLEVSIELSDIVQKFRNLRRTGGNINRDLRRQKQFKNPDLIGRLIKENNVIEIGSNYDESKFNPFKWKASSFVSSLSIAQAKFLEEEKKKLELQQSRKDTRPSQDKSKKTHRDLNRRDSLDERDLKRRRNDR
jgi:hypothetical protein